MKQAIILIMGPSGSGKSTLSEKLVKEIETESRYVCFQYEADNFFCYISPEEDKYAYDPNLIKYAHMDTQANLVRNIAFNFNHNKYLISEGLKEFSPEEMDIHIVSNTFTSAWEREEYNKIAKIFNIPIFVVNVGIADAEELYRRNSHNVPLNVIEKQINRLDIPDDAFQVPHNFSDDDVRCLKEEIFSRI